MNIKLLIYLIHFVLNKVLALQIPLGVNGSNKYSYSELNDHSMVTNSDVFPYVAAILKKSTYLSAGALIDENFVLTAADSLFLVRESKRVLRVRLGSINHKKGGVVLPIKFYEIHPYFSDTKPQYDIALIKLAQPVRFTPRLNPIRLQKRVKEVTATHFTVTAWPNLLKHSSDELQQLQSMEEIQRRRMLQVSHLHPTDAETCQEEVEGMDVNVTDTLMCLEPAFEDAPCSREVGAPVVLNGILWGIISSWRPEDCEVEPGPSFVSLVAANDIATWIHATVRGHRWTKQFRVVDYEVDDDYDENND